MIFIVPDVNDVLAEEEEKSMFNPNLLKPTDIPIPEQYIANAKKQKKSMKTLTKLNMQLERNKEAAKKKHKKTTARTILKENIGNTNVLRGADILLIKKHNKKNKNVKRYVLCTFKDVLRNDFILLYLYSNSLQDVPNGYRDQLRCYSNVKYYKGQTRVDYSKN